MGLPRGRTLQGESAPVLSGRTSQRIKRRRKKKRLEPSELEGKERN